MTVVEKVARAISKCNVPDNEPVLWIDSAQAALAALEPGDDLPNGHVEAFGAGIMTQINNARAEEREACAQEAEVYDWTIWPDPGAALAAAIRARGDGE